MRSTRPAAASYALISIALIGCSMLMYEILLTRICALRLYFHFGYLIVSNCVLGIAASGSVITIFQERWRPQGRRWIWSFAVLYVVSLVLTYAFLIQFPIPPEMDFNSAADLGRFLLYMIVGAVPFFFAGSVVGLILTFHSEHVNTVYFLDLVGAGIGCLLTPLVLSLVGAGGAMVVVGLLGVGAVVASAPDRLRMPVRVGGGALALAGLVALPSVDARFPVPGKLFLDLTNDTAIQLGRLSEWSRWSTNSRIDLLPVHPHQRFLFARGRKQQGARLPEQRLIMQDGWAGTFVTNYSENPAALEILRGTTYSASVRLKTDPRVLIIGAGGGNDVWAAKISEPRRVRAIELNQQILHIHREVLADFSRGIVEDPRIELVHGEGRSELMRDDGEYDVVQMSGIDTYTALASGAYVMAENYLYTVEAIETMYERLAPDGILQITRFAMDMEMLRLLSNVYGAFQRMGVSDFARSLIVLQTYDGLATTMIKRGVFTAEERESVRAFAERSGVTISYMPGRDAENVFAEFIVSDSKREMIAEFPRDISPTTDDRPYFFFFSKWRNPIRSAEEVLEASSISKGSPVFILGQFVASCLLSGLLILLPLVVFRRRGTDSTHAGRFLLYFVGLGLGFICIEIALMQKLTLFLGHPVYSITVTLFAMLFFTGVGSLASQRWFRAPGARAWLVPVLLALLVGFFLLVSPALVAHFIGSPLALRIALVLALIAPIGLVLGVPFAYGIRLLDRFNPSIIPWAWAVNGAFTVIGSILTVILSMNFGFRFVLLFAVAVYFVAFTAIRGLPGARGAAAAPAAG
ncbi:MAG: hypothetical protein QNK03_00080 [Myxococcota bacterium]|nr:hypothetical protein [Myxococcota bacterium]